ncbi:MAG TPA: elongation factor G [Candidatus Atribacteria bacterium]|nr:elongation factor G [Candidatus Atribacteria bacterium]
MTKYDIKKVRNIALVGHGDSGKTSLTEALLYDSGMITRLGDIKQGNTTTDYDPREIKKGITINSSLAYLNLKDLMVNILDTPGYLDFITDTKLSLRVVDSAIVVVCAVSGVEVQTEKVWNFADEYKLPRAFFINKMDRERADFYRVKDMIKEIFGTSAISIQLPIGKEENFQGLIDLVEMKAIIYKKIGEGKPVFEKQEIPQNMKEEAESYRKELVERVAEFDDEILMKYLDGETLTNREIASLLKRGIKENKIVPILCGSATMNLGIELLLDFIGEYFPSPSEMPPVVAKNGNTSVEQLIENTVDSSFSAFVFKTVADPYVGNLTYFRVYSGKLSEDSNIYNSSKNVDNKVGKIYKMQGKNQNSISEVYAGDIAAVAKLKNTVTGDTLCDKDNPVLFEKIDYPEPIMLLAISPKTKGDEDKLSTALSKIIDEDPTVKIYRDEDTGESILAGMGESHLEVIIDTMESKFGVEVERSTPKVGYKETIRKNVKVEGKYKKQSGGRGQYGHCWLELEPKSRGEGFEFVDKIVGGVIPRQYRPAVEKGVVGAMKKGILAGYPTVDIKATVYDGSYHPVDSSEMAFKVAGSMAFKKGAAEANPILLEPIMDIEVIVPKEYMGDIIGDLNSKRGKIMGMEESSSGKQSIKAKIPQAEIFKYAIDLRSITQGRGTFNLKFSHYEEVPANIVQEIITKNKEEEEENNNS